MSTVLFLSNQQIQVVTGSADQKKVSVAKTYVADTPEGSIINGIIMDSESFITFIKDFWTENKLPNKDVTLVINSSKFIGQTIELPKLKDSQTIEYINREFADIRKDENSIYGYIPLKDAENGMRRVYAEAISSEFIGEYVEIFKEANIGIKSVHSGESSLIALTELTVASFYDTFIMMIADRVSLITLLWVDKRFYYFNSTRCFHEQGTEDYAMDIARSVSQIIQFMKAHQIEHELQSIQLAGVDNGDLRMYQNALQQQGIFVQMEAYSSSALSSTNEELHNVLQATSGLITKGKYQNFLVQYYANNKKNKSKNSSTPIFIMIAVVFILMLVATIITFVMRMSKQKELNAVEEELHSPLMMDQLAEYEKLLNRNDFLRKQHDAINDIDENILTYPICDEAIIRMMQKCAEGYATVEFESFDAEEGRVTVVAKSDDVDRINQFIRELNKQEIFKKIDYTGYAFDETDKLWDIHVICTLAEGTGQE